MAKCLKLLSCTHLIFWVEDWHLAGSQFSTWLYKGHIEKGTRGGRISSVVRKFFPTSGLFPLLPILIFLSSKNVLVSLGCPNKVPQTGWLVKNRNVFLMILEAGSLR